MPLCVAMLLLVKQTPDSRRNGQCLGSHGLWHHVLEAGSGSSIEDTVLEALQLCPITIDNVLPFRTCVNNVSEHMVGPWDIQWHATSQPKTRQVQLLPMQASAFLGI